MFDKYLIYGDDDVGKAIFYFLCVITHTYK